MIISCAIICIDVIRKLTRKEESAVHLTEFARQTRKTQPKRSMVTHPCSKMMENWPNRKKIVKTCNGGATLEVVRRNELANDFPHALQLMRSLEFTLTSPVNRLRRPEAGGRPLIPRGDTESMSVCFENLDHSSGVFSSLEGV